MRRDRAADGAERMPTVADVVRRYGEEYLERFGARCPRSTRRCCRRSARAAPASWGPCSTPAKCCGRTHAMGRSCGNRHCPTCQQHKTKAWLEKQTGRLLPCPYFLLTFTLPAELRDFARQHQRVVYDCAVRGVQPGDSRAGRRPEVHRQFALRLLRRPAHLGPDAGVPSPCALRGSRRSRERRRRRSGCRRGADFFLPVAALSILFRAKFRDLLDAGRTAGPDRPGRVAPRLGRALAGRRRRPSVAWRISRRTSFAWPSATGGSSPATTVSVTFSYRKSGEPATGGR